MSKEKCGDQCTCLLFECLNNVKKAFPLVKTNYYFYCMFRWIAEGFVDRDKNTLDNNREILHKYLEKAFEQSIKESKEYEDDN